MLGRNHRFLEAGTKNYKNSISENVYSCPELFKYWMLVMSSRIIIMTTLQMALQGVIVQRSH